MLISWYLYTRSGNSVSPQGGQDLQSGNRSLRRTFPPGLVRERRSWIVQNYGRSLSCGIDEFGQWHKNRRTAVCYSGSMMVTNTYLEVCYGK